MKQYRITVISEDKKRFESSSVTLEDSVLDSAERSAMEFFLGKTVARIIDRVEENSK